MEQQNIPFLEIYSDDKGEAMFYGDRTETYYAVVTKGSAKSTKNGYIIKGVAQNESDVNLYKQYYMPNIQIGDIIYLDLNGDAQLDAEDKSDYVYVEYDEHYPLQKEIYISD